MRQPIILSGKGGTGKTNIMAADSVYMLIVSWLTIAYFTERYRVISPVYPAVKTMSALVDGIDEIVRHEDVKQAHVLGGSYGGFVAHVFVRRHPQMTRSLARALSLVAGGVVERRKAI